MKPRIHEAPLDTDFYVRSDAGWVLLSTAAVGLIDHGGLLGLGDDDHAQYLLASDATNRATFAANWTDLTDAGNTTLHTHSIYSLIADIDDTPVNGVTDAPISSNWAYDHANGADPHAVYALADGTRNFSGTVTLTTGATTLAMSESGATAQNIRVYNSAGGLKILNNADGSTSIKQTTSAAVNEDDWITMARNGAVTLYYNGTNTFRTQTNKVQYYNGSTWVDLGGTPAWEYTSAETTLTYNSQNVVSHGLGAIPTKMLIVLICKTANAGFAIGDYMVMAYTYGGYGAQWGASATQIWLSVPVSGIYATNKNGGGQTVLTAASWKIIFRCSL